MNTFILYLQPLAWAVLLTAGTVQAHGLGIMEESAKAVVVRAAYSDGEPLAYAEFKVFGPGSSTQEFQAGRTDALGRFAFTPDVPGQWTVHAADGMGHATRRIVQVSEALQETPSQLPAAQSANNPKPSLTLATLGASLLLNVSALVVLLRRRP